MWFLVPRSRPLAWVIVKVQASNQYTPWLSHSSTLLFPAKSRHVWLSTVILYALIEHLNEADILFAFKKKKKGMCENHISQTSFEFPVFSGQQEMCKIMFASAAKQG